MYQRHIPFILQDAGQAHLFWEILPQLPAHRAFFPFNFYNSLLSDPFVRQLSNIRIVIYILCFLHQQAMHYETSLFHNKLLSKFLIFLVVLHLAYVMLPSLALAPISPTSFHHSVTFFCWALSRVTFLQILECTMLLPTTHLLHTLFSLLRECSLPSYSPLRSSFIYQFLREGLN